MKSRWVSVVLCSGLALGSTLGCAMQTGSPSEDGASAPGSSQSAVTAQNPMAETTLKLEKAFADQFVRGEIDRSELSGLIDDVVQSAPEAARPQVQQHIEDVLQAGQKLAAQLTPEQRAEAAAPPAQDKIDKTMVDVVGNWGYPGAQGFGGMGAFAFPGMYGGGYGHGGGFGPDFDRGHHGGFGPDWEWGHHGGFGPDWDWGHHGGFGPDFDHGHHRWGDWDQNLCGAWGGLGCGGWYR